MNKIVNEYGFVIVSRDLQAAFLAPMMAEQNR